MRIQRLAQENQSMQGPNKRAWYQRNSPAHLEAIRALTLAALETQGPSPIPRVAILGAGACTELPLEEIAERAEEVALIDLDELALQQARRRLSAALQGRVRLVVADVTGKVSASLERALMSQRWQALKAQGADAVLTAAAGCLERCDVPQPPELAEVRPGRCGVVISSLVVTQLWSYPLLDVTDLLNTLDPALAGQQHAHLALGPAIERFKLRVARGHLLLLARLLRPTGAAVLIAEDEGRLTPQQGNDQQGLDTPLPLLPDGFDGLIEASFIRTEPARGWEWISDWPSAVRAGRTYHVTGLVLRPKQADGSN
ncbi:MAG TPA: hypothetical protein VKT82_09435 [Ktedonobacterales bacterium]|nr:hypothetical protein [Ktedonobacterales bacterium]